MDDTQFRVTGAELRRYRSCVGPQTTGKLAFILPQQFTFSKVESAVAVHTCAAIMATYDARKDEFTFASEDDYLIVIGADKEQQDG